LPGLARPRLEKDGLVVADVEAAHAELAGRGVDVSDVQHFPWGSFVFFTDPDGNGWTVQQLPARD
jgi:uncharacterized glyoxalase superfamily protein PhnB